MHWQREWWVFYLLVEATRVLAFRFRLRFPTLHGPDTFFSLNVPPDFFAGPGRRLLRIYHLGLPVPYLIEAILLGPVFYWGYRGWMMFAVICTSLMLFLWGRWWMHRVIRMAKPYALPCGASNSAVSLGLEPRELANYRSLPMELVVWAFDLGALILLAQSVRNSMSFFHLNIGNLMGLLLRLLGFAQFSAGTGSSYGDWLFWPLILAHIQVGAMLVKYAVVAWPMRLSTDAAGEIRKYREGVRRYFIRTCDWFRIVFALALLTTSFEVRFPEVTAHSWWKWLNYSLSFGLLILILTWYYINVRCFMRQARNFPKGTSGPKASRIIDPARFRLGGLVYYDPDSPSVLVPSRAGYALNFADRRAYITLAYFGGLALLALIHLRFGWG
jgi:uncharacterized membrane protein